MNRELEALLKAWDQFIQTPKGPQAESLYSEYQAQLDGALSWLLTVPDPRQIEQPEIQLPLIRLLPSEQLICG